MTKAEYLKMCSQHWDELENLHKHKHLYDFEQDFARMAQEHNRRAFEALLGDLPKDHRKKKLSLPSSGR